jgi:hypothetical protein
MSRRLAQPGTPIAILILLLAAALGVRPAASAPAAGAIRATLVFAPDTSGLPQVKVFDAATQQLRTSFLAFAPTFTGGVRVATGDVNGDGTPDIIAAAGAGDGPQVKVFDGKTLAVLHSFFAFDPAFTGGVFVASGDVNGDGVVDIIAGAGSGGGPQVKVFDGKDLNVLRNFFAYSPTFTGGVQVASGDVNGDGFADIITGAGAGGGPQVKAFDGKTGAVVHDFFAYSANFTGGVFVASGDVNGDGFADIITGAGAGGGPHVRVFNGKTEAVMQDFFAFDPGFTDAVRIAGGDVNGDGFVDIIAGAGAGGGPRVRVFDGNTGKVLHDFLAFDAAFGGGVFVAGGYVQTSLTFLPIIVR